MAIETYHKVNYPAGTTGAQTMLDVNHNHVNAVGVDVGAGTTADFDIQIQLKRGSTETRHVHTSGASADTFVRIAHPVQAIGLNITTNTGGSGITIEIRTASRGS